MHKIALMVSNLSSLGGTERVTANLSHVLKESYECHVITLWNNGTMAYPIDKGIPIFNLYPQKYRLRYILLDAVKRICQYLKDKEIEILIVVGRNNGIIPLLVRLISSTKLIYCEHNSILSYRFYNESFRVKTHRHLLQFLMYHVPDYVVTLTEKDLAFYKNKSIKSCRIYNAMDKRLFTDEVSYQADSKKIVTVARIDFQKGLEYLVEIAKKVLSVHTDWTWDVWGTGDKAYINNVIRNIENAGLTGRLRLMGSSLDMYDLYNKYGLYVLTSRYEGLPMVLLEAKAKKLPIVSFDIYSGPSDIVRDGVDGFLVKPFDVNKMAEKINILIENKSLRQSFSDASYGNLDKFKEDSITRQWERLINDTLDL
ncbi:glycosyltransferase family 4 protein [uncultured Mitsuokella sp.]|uniref:glycosyltransferase family 4 protein n=1 Tax=uncultured Mitsuokella sp. TaxID=453120 RepID=UPI0026302C97|nr:glycosyltransferase family 4 protein [uncultured Mitsuokella sp.]